MIKKIIATALLAAGMCATAFGQTGVTPKIVFLETDQTLPAGLWRIQVDGDTLTIDRNTSGSNNFSSAITALTLSSSGNITISGDGPHAIGNGALGNIRLLLGGAFTSSGVGSDAKLLLVQGTLTGAAGDIDFLTGTEFDGRITTQTATESIENVSQAQFNEPRIVDNLTGSIDNAQTVLITDAPTEGVSNFAFRIISGTSSIKALIIDVTDAEALIVRLDGDAGDLFTVDGVSGNTAEVTARTDGHGLGVIGAVNNVGIRLQSTGSGGALWRILTTAGSSGFGQGNLAIDRNDNNPRLLFENTLTRFEQSPVVIDMDNAEAFLVRKDADGGDVFIVDTTNETLTVSGTDQTGFPPDTRTFFIDTASRKVTIFGTQAGLLLEGRTANTGFSTVASFTNDIGGPDRGSGIDLGITTFPMARLGGAMGVSTAEGYMRFDTRLGGVLAEKMRLTKDGDLQLLIDAATLQFGASSDITLERVSARVLQMNSDPLADSDNELRIVARDDPGVERYLELFAQGTNTARVAARKIGGGGRFDLELFTSSGDVEIHTDGVQRWTFNSGSGGRDFELLPFITDTYDIGTIAQAVRDFYTNAIFVGQDQTSAVDAITLDATDLVGDGQQDSGAIVLTGLSFESATPHDKDFKVFVEMQDNAGVGRLLIQSRLDGAGFADRFEFTDTADLLMHGGIIRNVSGVMSIGSATDQLVTFAQLNSVRWIIGTASDEQAFYPNVDDTHDIGLPVRNVRQGFFNLLTVGLTNSTAVDAITIDAADLGGDGQQDSGAIILTGLGFESATPHDIDWKQFVDVTANDGTGSIWTLQTRIDGGAFVDRLTIADASSTLGLPDDTASIQFGAALDAQIHRDGPDALGQRRGNNGQAWYVYDEFTDLSNFSRLAMYAGGPPPKVFEIEVQTAGTGTDVIDLTLSSAGAGSFVRMETGDNFFISLESGILQFSPDNSISIGNSNSNRPNSGFFGGQLQVGILDTSSSGTQVLTLDSPNLTSGPTQRDSHSIIVTGQGHTGAAQHDGDWKQFADVKDTLANSNYTWSFRTDSSFFQNKVSFGFNSDPDTALPGGLMVMDQATDASTNFKLRNVSITANSGVVTLSNTVPAGRFLLGVTTRISAVLTGGGVTGYSVGDGSDVDRWGTVVGTAVDTTSDSTDFTADPLQFSITDEDIVITFTGGNPSSGTVQVISHYFDLSPPQCTTAPCP